MKSESRHESSNSHVFEDMAAYRRVATVSDARSVDEQTTATTADTSAK